MRSRIPQPHTTLESALFDADGEPRPIERVALEPQGRGRFRWAVWSEGQEISALDALPAEELAGWLDIVAVLLRAEMGAPTIPQPEWN